jgi:hypothetical protein
MAPDERPRDVESVRRALRGEAPPPMRRAAPPLDRAGHDLARDALPDDDDDAAQPPRASSTPPAANESAAASTANDAKRRTPLLAPRAKTRDPRLVVATFAVLGAVVLAGGAWTLNRTGPASPALASLAAALHSADRAGASSSHIAHATSPVDATRAGVVGMTPASRPIAVEPESASAVRVETAMTAPAVDVPFVVPADASSARVVAADASAPPPAAPAPPPRVRTVDRHAVAARPPDAAQHARLRDSSARTRTVAANSPGACSGLSTFSRMLCTLGECKSPLSTEPKCVRGRQIEQARLARMERE